MTDTNSAAASRTEVEETAALDFEALPREEYEMLAEKAMPHHMVSLRLALITLGKSKSELADIVRKMDDETFDCFLGDWNL
jgi:hypothetical protein